MNLVPVQTPTVSIQKINPTLDDRQKRVALLLASGEFDTFCDRIRDGLNDLATLKEEYVTTILEKDRDGTSIALTTMAGIVERIGDQADNLAREGLKR